MNYYCLTMLIIATCKMNSVTGKKYQNSLHTHTHTQDLQGGLIQDTGQVVKKDDFLKEA